MTTSRVLICGAVIVLVVACSRPAAAQGAGNSCTISTTAVAFGAYDVFNSSPVTSTGTVVFRCGSAVQSISIALSSGQSGSYSPRRLAGGGETLSYNLYRDAARTVVWGDGSSGTQAYVNGNPPKNTDVTLTIYGEVPASQDVRAGSYGDTLMAIVNW